MSKHVTSGLAAVILTLTLSALAFAQTTTTTTQKTVVQNPDGTYTVIEYPVKKEITLNLTPVAIQGAKGVATILRDDDGTRIKLNLTNVPADVTARSNRDHEWCRRVGNYNAIVEIHVDCFARDYARGVRSEHEDLLPQRGAARNGGDPAPLESVW